MRLGAIMVTDIASALVVVVVVVFGVLRIHRSLAQLGSWLLDIFSR
jgi:hypothetical protein